MARPPELLRAAGPGGLERIFAKHPQLQKQWTVRRAYSHLGTLGTGNHSVEICLDKSGSVWVMLHLGSRGTGNRIGTYFIEKAKEDMRRWFINLPDQDLAYIPQGSELFHDYCLAVKWAQEYALINRGLMMEVALSALSTIVSKTSSLIRSPSIATTTTSPGRTTAART